MRYTGTIDFTIRHETADEVTAEMPITPGVLNPFGADRRRHHQPRGVRMSRRDCPSRS